MCVGSAFFFCLVLLGLDLGALVADEFEDIVVVENFCTGIQDLEESVEVSLKDSGERTFMLSGSERCDQVWEVSTAQRQILGAAFTC